MSKTIITGGAGFIGFHCARRLLQEGHEVHVADNLSRNGARANYGMLVEISKASPGSFHFHHVDLRNRQEVESLVQSASPDLVLHEAAQVAVTTSVANPILDFEINALGTLNLLEAVRRYSPEAFFVFASTNKVYGNMEDIVVVEEASRYRYRDCPEGVDESRGLDFHSPYACSKGVADQYVHDYSRIYGLRTVVFRQSCIYGTHQYGVEDQGWIAWFIIARVLGLPVTIYGTGKQVRDILWAEDLVEAYLRAWHQDARGEVFNIGGGAGFSLSLLELVDMINQLHPVGLPLRYGQVRPGDQPVYIANAAKARQKLAWQPRMAPRAGVAQLYAWVVEHQQMIAQTLKY